MAKAKILIVANNKGGIGKTATTAAFGDLLSRCKEYSVLLIDSDPQGNLSSKFGFDPAERRDNYIGALIANRLDNNVPNRPVEEFINSAQTNLDIIVSDQRLDAIYSTLASTPIINTLIFKNIIEEIKAINKYDYVIFDTRPSLSNEVGAALVASDWLVIPIMPAADSITGASDMFQFASQCRNMNPNLKTAGVFFNRVQSRTSAFQEAMPLVQENWRGYMLDTVIPQNQSVINAENFSEPFTRKFPGSKASKAFAKLLDEVLVRIA